MGKGEITRNEQFLLFPQCFLIVWRTLCHFHEIQNSRLQTLSVWKSVKFVVWLKRKLYHHKRYGISYTCKSAYRKTGLVVWCGGWVRGNGVAVMSGKLDFI